MDQENLSAEITEKIYKEVDTRWIILTSNSNENTKNNI